MNWNCEYLIQGVIGLAYVEYGCGSNVKWFDEVEVGLRPLVETEIERYFPGRKTWVDLEYDGFFLRIGIEADVSPENDLAAQSLGQALLERREQLIQAIGTTKVCACHFASASRSARGKVTYLWESPMITWRTRAGLD